MGDEKRQHLRIPQAIPIRLKFEGADDFARAYTENISLGGVFVPTNADVPIGTKVDLTIELMPGKGFKVGAQVSWQRPGSGDQPAGVGLRFFQLQPTHKKWLQEVLDKHLTQKGFAGGAKRARHLREASAGAMLTDSELNMAKAAFAEGQSPILGIDLGTSNSCACVFLGEEPVILELAEEQTGADRCTIPSVVSYGDGDKTTVGHFALQGLAKNSSRTIFGSKRFVGRDYNHPEVQNMLARYPYRVVPGGDRRVAVEIDGRKVSLIEVAAKILGYIRVKAQKRLRRPVTRAIITVPACYNQNQRNAVVDAGRLAGFTVERIINEPTAAAIAYGVISETQGNILVYDLGGGTFDVSVMAVEGDRLRVLATAGDTFLGGEDFDNALVEYVCQRAQKEQGLALSKNHAALAVVKAAVEKTKCRLSLHEASMVMVRDAMMASGERARLEVELGRDEVEKVVAPFVQNTLAICDLALTEAGLTRKQVDEVLLVGGQTLMPCVRQAVDNHFGTEARCDLRPDQVVARGAAILTHLESAQRPIRFQDALPMSIGIAVGKKFKKLIKRNTAVPCTATYTMHVPADQLAQHQLEVYQGERNDVSRNEHLGTLRLDAVTAGPDPMVELRVAFELTASCMLELRLTNVQTNQTASVLLDTVDTR